MFLVNRFRWFQCFALCLGITLAWPFGNLYAQDLYGASVDALTGNVNAHWHEPNPAGVIDYSLEWGTSPTIFTDLLSGIGANTSNSVNFSPSVNANINKYFIRLTRNPVSGPSTSVEFQSIFLSLGVLNGGATAHLEWNPVDVNLAGTYNIELDIAGVWTQVGTLTYASGPVPANITFDYNMSSPWCISSPASFRVRFQSAVDPLAESISNVATATGFIDKTPPDNVTGDTVSIATGSPQGVVIGWDPVTTSDVDFVEIWRREINTPEVFGLITTLPVTQTSYMDLNTPNKCLSEYEYSIVLVDKCGNRSYGTYNRHTRNIFLHVVPDATCLRVMHLDWRTYYSLPGGLDGYKVLFSTDGAVFTTVASVTDTTYDHSYNFQNSKQYYYKIMAYSNASAATSTTCIHQVTYSGSEMPDSIIVTAASVEDDSWVKVGYVSVPDHKLRKIVLERGTSPQGPFVPVDSLQSASPSLLPDLYTLSDHTANVHSLSYYYRMKAEDDCGVNFLYSVNMGRTVLLQCNAVNNEANLAWNPYEEWLQGVEKYDIEFSFNQDPPANLATITPPGAAFVADISLYNTTDILCYKVIAHENTGNPYSANEVSVSNTCCLVRDAMIYFPNAFRPQGVNNVYKPILYYVSSQNYLFEVYNKWGKLIFSTTNPEQGWDGNLNLYKASTDVFVYRLVCKSELGNDIEKRGTFLLLK